MIHNVDWGVVCFLGFFVFMVAFMGAISLNRYLCEHHNTKCLWCKQLWIGRGCGCISRNKIGRSTTPGSSSWQALTFQEKLYHRMRFNQRGYLKARREGNRTTSQFYASRRDAYLEALNDYQLSAK